MVVLLFLIGELLEGVAAGRARASIRASPTSSPRPRSSSATASTEEVRGVLARRRRHHPGAPGRPHPSGRRRSSPARARSTRRRSRARARPSARSRTTPCSPAPSTRMRPARAGHRRGGRQHHRARRPARRGSAGDRKAPTERFIDRFSRWYTPGVLVVGALVAVVPPLLFGAAWGEWIYKGLAILLIGCPCALVISTPAAIAAGLSAGARRGLLIKGGAVLETLGQDHHRRLRQDRHAHRGQAARSPTSSPVGATAKRRSCSWRPPWRPDRAIRSPRPSSTRRRGGRHAVASRQRRRPRSAARASPARSAARDCSSGRPRPRRSACRSSADLRAAHRRP